MAACWRTQCMHRDAGGCMEPAGIPGTRCWRPLVRRVVRWRCLRDECAQPHSEELRACLGSEDGAANAALYLLLRAVDRFHAAHNRFPGAFDGCCRRAAPSPLAPPAALHALP